MAGKRKVTLSIDPKVYKDFQRFCEENAIMLSKDIELYMKDRAEGKKDRRTKPVRKILDGEDRIYGRRKVRKK